MGTVCTLWILLITRPNCALDRRVGVFMSLEFREKSLSMLNFVGIIKESERTKEEQRECPCCGICLQFT